MLPLYAPGPNDSAVEVRETDTLGIRDAVPAEALSQVPPEAVLTVKLSGPFVPVMDNNRAAGSVVAGCVKVKLRLGGKLAMNADRLVRLKIAEAFPNPATVAVTWYEP